MCVRACIHTYRQTDWQTDTQIPYSSKFLGLKFCEILLMKSSSQNAWLVDEEVSVVDTNISQNFERFTKILSWKFTFKAKWHKSQKFLTTEIRSYKVWHNIHIHTHTLLQYTILYAYYCGHNINQTTHFSFHHQFGFSVSISEHRYNWASVVYNWVLVLAVRVE